ncbi:MAG: hypothetical protein IJ222_07890 [Bacteroidales bacterium]|nr:hypothetical protein [Bacteroidales bacterium]
MDIAFCHDCKELTYALPDHNNGIHTNTSGAHFGPRHHLSVLNINDPNLPAPVKWVVLKMNRDIECTDNELLLAALAIELGGLDYLLKTS